MTTPVRIQVRRTKGFRLQDVSLAINGLPAIAVTRPGTLGNPFKIAAAIESGFATTPEEAQKFVVECFDDWMAGGRDGRDWWQGSESDKAKAAIMARLPSIRGHNIGCACALDQPCHGDWYLREANK